jgi:hypothetical protein
MIYSNINEALEQNIVARVESLQSHQIREVVKRLEIETYNDNVEIEKNDFILTFNNGLLDCSGNEIRLIKPSPKYFSTHRIMFDYNDKAYYPELDK